MARRPTTTPRRNAVRSIRVSEEVWAAAKARATAENVTMNEVLSEFVSGYASNRLDLPIVKRVYTPIRPEADDVADEPIGD